MRARFIVLAGAVFAGGLLAAASAQEGRPFESIRSALDSLTSRVGALEQQASTIPQLTGTVASIGTRVSGLEQQSLSARDLTVVDNGGLTIGRATFNGNNSYAVMVIDGVTSGFPVTEGGFRQSVPPTVWFQSTDCSGDAFVVNDTGVIRQGLVVGSAGLYPRGQFRSIQFRSRRAYPSGACAGLTFTTTGAELTTVDLSVYHAPFTVGP